MSLSDMFTEVAAEEEAVLDGEGVDNPDDVGADEEDVVDDIDSDDGDEVDVDDEDADISDDDDESDEEPAAEDGDFDWNEILDKFGDRTVTVQVQGEPVEVKVKDLPNGFMMREDYSRKTAELAQARRAAAWAQDVQKAMQDDPVGTLRAFAEAYQVGDLFANQQAQQDQGDPYEDFDPDVAAVLRRMDEQEQRYQEQLRQQQAQIESFQNRQIMEEVKAEVASLRDEFGDELDHVEMLRVAATHNVPLREAAEYLVGRQYFAKSREQLELEAQAKEAAGERTDRSRQRAKKRASSTATKKFDASDVSAEDFNTIGELFEIEMNSVR